MTDGADGSGLSQRTVETSYAISMAVFLAPLMIWAGLTGDGPWDLFLIPLYTWRLSSTVTLTIRLFVLLFPLLGVSGFVVSVRQPNRVGWFICGHVCLIVYYGIWWLSLLCTIGDGGVSLLEVSMLEYLKGSNYLRRLCLANTAVRNAGLRTPQRTASARNAKSVGHPGAPTRCTPNSGKALPNIKIQR